MTPKPMVRAIPSFKPIPDEEGTETARASIGSSCACAASNRSPMRRGLKRASLPLASGAIACFKPIPDEEGTETQINSLPKNSAMAQASNRSPMRRGLKRTFLCQIRQAHAQLQTDPR